MKINDEIKLPKTLELITCPNPKCRKRIEELIVVSNSSTTPAEQYYACPHCYMKLDWISTQLQTEKEEKLQVEPLEMKEKGHSRCPHYFGYLAMRACIRGGDVPVPPVCLDCPKVLDCVMETSDS